MSQRNYKVSPYFEFKHSTTLNNKEHGFHNIIVNNLVKPWDWLTTLDLKDVYFLVPIYPSHHNYLQFLCQGATYVCTHDSASNNNQATQT